MKSYAALTFLAFFFPVNGRISCWECENARSEEDCVERGQMRRCQDNEGSCQTEFRRIGWEPTMLISKRCKQTLACHNNFIQNPRPSWNEFQCNMKSPSAVCRCCCGTDLCNKDEATCWEQEKLTPNSCEPSQRNPQNGAVVCTKGNDLGSICAFTCKEKFEVKGSSSILCLPTGKWDSPAPVCAPMSCFPPLQSLGNGEVSCTDGNAVGSTCRFSCNNGFKLEGAEQSTCGASANGGRWSNPLPICPETIVRDLEICNKQENPENGQVICTDEWNLGSVCTFRCNTGYQVAGKEAIECSKDGGEVEWTDDSPKCQVATCNPPLTAPLHGDVFCSDVNFLGSLCAFFCSPSHQLVGQSLSECDYIADVLSWSNPVPACARIECPSPLEAPTNGQIFCSNGITLGSKCNFTCNPEYELVGDQSSECLEGENGDILWSKPVPFCKEKACQSQLTFAHGQSTCTNFSFPSSTCKFACTATGYHLHPETFVENTCQEDLTWNVPTPCCALDCPPHAVMDFVIVLDSSSSVGVENWKKMKEFVGNFLEVFTVSSEATLYGIFRYNGEVDDDTQILLKDFTDDKNALLDAFQKIPYNGVGTRTGKALKHVNDVMLSANNGNRPKVRDVVLIVTDGSSQDEVKDEAKILRDSGALVFVVPVRPPGGNVNLNEVLVIASREDYIIGDAIDGGFEALTADLSRRVASKICGDPCDHAFHDLV